MSPDHGSLRSELPDSDANRSRCAATQVAGSTASPGRARLRPRRRGGRHTDRLVRLRAAVHRAARGAPPELDHTPAFTGPARRARFCECPRDGREGSLTPTAGPSLRAFQCGKLFKCGVAKFVYGIHFSNRSCTVTDSYFAWMHSGDVSNHSMARFVFSQVH